MPTPNESMSATMMLRTRGGPMGSEGTRASSTTETLPAVLSPFVTLISLSRCW